MNVTKEITNVNNKYKPQKYNITMIQYSLLVKHFNYLVRSIKMYKNLYGYACVCVFIAIYVCIAL